MAQAKTPSDAEAIIRIEGIERRTISLWIAGTQLLTNRFGGAALAEMKRKQEAGSLPKGQKKSTKAAKKFDDLFESAKYTAHEGWCGIKCIALRNAMIAAAPLLGLSSVLANLSIWILADGYDRDDGSPLLEIHCASEPEQFLAPAQNTFRGGKKVIDLRIRPLWNNWRINPKIEFNAKVFTEQEIGNLLNHAGLIGIGDGRPGSPNSNGIGMGMFEVVPEEQPVAKRKGRVA